MAVAELHTLRIA